MGFFFFGVCVLCGYGVMKYGAQQAEEAKWTRMLLILMRGDGEKNPPQSMSCTKRLLVWFVSCEYSTRR